MYRRINIARSLTIFAHNSFQIRLSTRQSQHACSISTAKRFYTMSTTRMILQFKSPNKRTFPIQNGFGFLDRKIGRRKVDLVLCKPHKALISLYSKPNRYVISIALTRYGWKAPYLASSLCVLYYRFKYAMMFAAIMRSRR